MKNMPILDDPKRIKRYDHYRMLETIEDFNLQAQQAWQEVKKIDIPKNYKKADKIVINGMGGSGLAGHIIKELFKDQLRVPLEVINSYTLPWYLDRHTLYIISSFSGSTEEPIGTRKMAAWRKAKIMGITTGSTLGSFLKKHDYPGYIFNPKFNYCKQPRLGLPYSLAAHLGLLKKVGYLKITDRDMKQVGELLDRFGKKWGARIKQKDNTAKQLASYFYGKVPVIVGSQFLNGNIHTIANQLNENSKNYANYLVIPEMNHHFLEGLLNPKTNRQQFRFLFLESTQYLPRISARYKVTQKILKKNGFRFEHYRLQSQNALEQVFEVLTLGSFLSFYLAVLNKIDPSPIPWVDLFKKELTKHSKKR